MKNISLIPHASENNKVIMESEGVQHLYHTYQGISHNNCRKQETVMALNTSERVKDSATLQVSQMGHP